MGRLARNHVCSLVVPTKQIVPAASDVDWPSLATIQASQSRNTPPPNSETMESGMAEDKGGFWIPQADADLMLRLLVVSQCGSIGHRGMDATESILKENFIWEGMQADVAQFVRGCFHCMVPRSGKMIPHPLRYALHGKNPNDVVPTDLL